MLQDLVPVAGSPAGVDPAEPGTAPHKTEPNLALPPRPAAMRRSLARPRLQPKQAMRTTAPWWFTKVHQQAPGTELSSDSFSFGNPYLIKRIQFSLPG